MPQSLEYNAQAIDNISRKQVTLFKDLHQSFSYNVIFNNRGYMSRDQSVQTWFFDRELQHPFSPIYRERSPGYYIS